MSKRMTGRTTRMMQEAVRLAKSGRAVYVVFASLSHGVGVVLGMSKDGVDVHQLGIKIETPETLTNLDWDTMTLKRAHPNCVLLVDHYVIERKMACALAMMTRFDLP
jgi:hypothetical protein